MEMFLEQSLGRLTLSHRRFASLQRFKSKLTNLTPGHPGLLDIQIEKLQTMWHISGVEIRH